MVGLDFTATDATLVRYTLFFCRHFQPEKIYFINVQRHLDVPDSVLQEFPNIEKPRDEASEDKMRKAT